MSQLLPFDSNDSQTLPATPCDMGTANEERHRAKRHRDRGALLSRNPALAEQVPQLGIITVANRQRGFQCRNPTYPKRTKR
jgi:hypothetical protein